MDTNSNWMWLPLYTIHSSGILVANWNIHLPKPLVSSTEMLAWQKPVAHPRFSYAKVARDSHAANIEDEG